ncbi:peptide ABC transporter substrate-binding protein [Paenibacillus sp. D51F]
MYKKTGLTLAALMIAGSVLAACGDGNNNSNSGNTGGDAAGNTATNNAANTGGDAAGNLAADQVFRMNLTSEPPTLDPALMQDNVSGTVAGGLFEGLTKTDKNGEIVGGMAEKWDVSEDGKTYTFHIRQGSKWSTGNPVTAHDFEFSWKRTLDPKAATPAPYAYQLYYLAGAEEYNTGKGSVDAVGVKAIDDNTLEVKLKNPTTYFLSLQTFYTYFPVDKVAAEKDPNWANEAATFSSNGPFKLAAWKHNDSVELAPNDGYYGKADVKLQKIQFSMIADSNTEFNSFNTGKLDWAGAPTGTIPLPQLAKLRKENDPSLQIKDTANTYFYIFNQSKKPFNNAKVRKALSMAIDRQLLIDRVVSGGQKPAFGFVPPSITGESKSFREETQDAYFKEDVAQAKTLLAEGLKEEGMASFPATTLLFNTSDAHKQIAEAVVDMWKTNLGIEVKPEVQEWKVFLKNRTALNYDIARAGWGADYNDAMTFLDLYVTGGGNNDIGHKNPEFDKLIKDAYASPVQADRVKMMAQAEKILIEDEMAVMPIYYYTSSELVNPKVKDVIMDYAGNINYNNGYIEK